jgi:Pentapeptide repeats (8 copies)
MAAPPRRFPPPWRADRTPHGYVVRDANGQGLACLFSRNSEAEAPQAKVLTKDEPRRIAVNVARLPELSGANLSGASLSGARFRGATSARQDSCSAFLHNQDVRHWRGFLAAAGVRRVRSGHQIGIHNPSESS